MSAEKTATELSQIYFNGLDHLAHAPERKALGMAYLHLLSMPHGVVRARCQQLLALCRDELAAEMHLDPETVQDMFEAFYQPTPPHQ